MNMLPRRRSAKVVIGSSNLVRMRLRSCSRYLIERALAGLRCRPTREMASISRGSRTSATLSNLASAKGSSKTGPGTLASPFSVCPAAPPWWPRSSDHRDVSIQYRHIWQRPDRYGSIPWKKHRKMTFLAAAFSGSRAAQRAVAGCGGHSRAGREPNRKERNMVALPFSTVRNELELNRDLAAIAGGTESYSHHLRQPVSGSRRICWQ